MLLKYVYLLIINSATTRNLFFYKQIVILLRTGIFITYKSGILIEYHKIKGHFLIYPFIIGCNTIFNTRSKDLGALLDRVQLG